MTLIPMFVFWAAVFWGLWSTRPVLLTVFFAALPLGTLAVIPPSLIGGFSFTAASAALLVLAVKHLVIRIGGSDEIANLGLGTRPGRLLVAFWLVATIITIFAPRFFAGRVKVVALETPWLGAVALEPTSQNLSQWGYLTISVLSVLVFAAYFREAERRQMLVDGLLLTGAIVIVTGVLDLASSWLPLGWLLEPFRTAQYQILDDHQLSTGAERVIGLMPEPASFGRISLATLALLYFIRHLASESSRRRLNRTMAGLVLMVVLSASSAGYGGLGVFVIVVLFDWLLRSAGGIRLVALRLGATSDLKAGLVVASVVLATALLSPTTFDPIVDRLDEVLINKTSTESFDERSMWTEVAYQAGVSSSLLGVGLGSTTASNYAVALFASTGLAGFSLYIAFALSLLRRRSQNGNIPDVLIGRAMRWSLPPLLAIDLAVATTPDFGSVHALRWGVLLALVPLASGDIETRVAGSTAVAVSAPAPRTKASGRGKVFV